MKGRWFRMYDEVLDDPKVQRLSGDDFKAWVNLLCLASRKEGQLPCCSDIGFALRLAPNKAVAILKRLVQAGLLVEDGDRFKPHGWDARQFKSDVSTDRVKRFRERSTKQPEAVSETVPDTDTETDVPLSNDNGGVIDSDKAFWDNAKAYLGKGKASLIGQWARDYGQPATASAITAAQLERAVNPVEFIVARLKAARPAMPVIGI